jgi:hypothetical protein
MCQNPCMWHYLHHDLWRLSKLDDKASDLYFGDAYSELWFGTLTILTGGALIDSPQSLKVMPGSHLQTGHGPLLPHPFQIIIHCHSTTWHCSELMTASLTHSLMEMSPSWEAANCAATQEIPSIYGTRRFTTVFTRALHWSLTLSLRMP